MSEYQNIELFAPRYVGERFENHRFPLELLEDLHTLQQMTIDMAKYLYLEDHQGSRQRAPKNFTKGFSFELESIDEGSAIPKIIMVAAMSGLFTSEYTEYFTRAKDRIIKTIAAAENGDNINLIAPDSVLYQFNKFGSKLKGSESIEFGNNQSVATFNKESRKKLILAASQSDEFYQDFTIRGSIPEMDQDKKTFQMQKADGKRIEGVFDLTHADTLRSAFNEYKGGEGVKVAITGTTKFSKTEKVLGIEEIENIEFLESFDVGYRFDELGLLKKGWLDGEGESIDLHLLSWVHDGFEQYFDQDLPLPNVFPTPEGSIQFEWSIKNYEISINFEDVIEVHTYDATKDIDQQVDFANNDDESMWQHVNYILKTAIQNG